MILRLPDSGSLIGALLEGLAQTPGTVSGDAVLSDVSAAQLDEALAALARGDIEYIVLEDDENFLQVAGEGDGPYQVQSSVDGALEEIAGEADAPTTRRLFHAYLRRDPAWRDTTA